MPEYRGGMSLGERLHNRIVRLERELENLYANIGRVTVRGEDTSNLITQAKINKAVIEELHAL